MMTSREADERRTLQVAADCGLVRISEFTYQSAARRLIARGHLAIDGAFAYITEAGDAALLALDTADQIAKAADRTAREQCARIEAEDERERELTNGQFGVGA